jgi:nitronate monooxygenase
MAPAGTLAPPPRIYTMPDEWSLPPLRIKGRTLLPIVQGGMGIGVSAHRLAGTVASLGGVGTIASVDLRRLHPDLMAATGTGRDKEAINAANLSAVDREVRAALAMAGGRGLVAVNVMRAVTEYAAIVKQACASGAQAIVMGAGLPMDLPELTAEYPDVALIPILSDVRGIGVVLKKWSRKGRVPDAIVIEHPYYAGGHLGSPRLEDIDDPRFDFETVLPGARELFASMGIEPGSIPLIAAGGINSPEKVRAMLALGASAVQVGTPFAVSEEGDAHPNFKAVLAGAGPEDIVTFMSDAGLPARGVRTPWLIRYLEREGALQERAEPGRCAVGFDCLSHCGLRDGNPKAGQFCIDAQLAAAVRGDVQNGLFFRGSEPLPFGAAIRPARELVAYLLDGVRPAADARPRPSAVPEACAGVLA